MAVVSTVASTVASTVVPTAVVPTVVAVVGNWWLVVGSRTALSVPVVVLLTFRNVLDDVDEFSVSTLVKFRVATHAHHHLFVH